jgi:transcriptional regulator with XRE-family HTH domain
MGRGTRPRPLHLAEKLIRIRAALGLSQNEMIRHLQSADELTQDYVSAYERGVREPPLPILLKYAQAANVYVDVLIDDELDLPTKLPSATKHTGLRRPASTRKGKRL